ncbi:MAG: PaaI family thioesterase [Paracoccaceae bacterium]
MDNFKVRDTDFIARAHAGFAQQEFLGLLGAKLHDVAAGGVEIHLPHKAELTQQHGYFHGGAIGTLADIAGGFAALTLMSADQTVLTVEYKLNIMAPATGEMLIVRGQVLRPGRNVTVCRSDVFSVLDGVEKLCATSLGTFMVMDS